MLAALRLVRPANLGVGFLGTVVGGLVALGTGISLPSFSWVTVLLAASSTALVTGGGNVLNDLRDRDGDRINHPERPLVTGETSVGRATALSVGLFVSGVAVAVPVIVHELLVGAILVAAVGGLLGYEFRWKARGFVGNLTVAGLTAMVFLYGGAAVGHAELLLPFAAMAFLATLSREIIKDMEDIRGDAGRSTLPMDRGLAFSARAARGSIVGAVGLSVVPFFWLVTPHTWPGVIYGLIVAVADALFVLSVRWLPQRLRLEQTVSKGAMTVALFAFLAVAFR